MALSSIEQKELVVAFGRDVRRVSADLFEATTEEVTKAQKNSAIAAGRRKVKEYGNLLSSLQGARRTEVETRYADIIRNIQSRLMSLEA